MMVSRQDQSTELQRDHNTRHEQQWLGQCDGWIRPWAVRALSGHAVHYDPAKEFDGARPAQIRNLSSAIAGKSDWWRLSCNKLQEFIFDRGAWDPSGNQHPRRSVCKVRYRKASQLLWWPCSVGFQEHRNKTKSEWSRKLWTLECRWPFSTFLLWTSSGCKEEFTDRGNIIVNRPVPFNLVKEVWFCVPKENDRRGFELIEKIMDEQLEDELVLEYQASPILRELRRQLV